MQDSPGRFQVLSCAVSRTAKRLAALSALLALACASGPNLVPVFLPGDRVECLFEVIGDVTVEGPFRARDDVPGGLREAILQDVRLKVGRRVAESGADGAMVREFIYEPDSVVAEASTPAIVAVEGMLISFVDPACAPGGLVESGGRGE